MPLAPAVCLCERIASEVVGSRDGLAGWGDELIDDQVGTISALDRQWVLWVVGWVSRSDDEVAAGDCQAATREPYVGSDMSLRRCRAQRGWVYS